MIEPHRFDWSGNETGEMRCVCGREWIHTVHRESWSETDQARWGGALDGAAVGALHVHGDDSTWLRLEDHQRAVREGTAELIEQIEALRGLIRVLAPLALDPVDLVDEVYDWSIPEPQYWEELTDEQIVLLRRTMAANRG